MTRVDRLWMGSRKIYRLFLMNIFLNGTIEPSLKMHKLFIFHSLAVPFETYEAFFRFEPVKTAIARFQVKLLVYNTEKEEIEQWIE